MKKIKLLIIAFTISIVSAKAQWVGPTSGILSTNNYVTISGTVVTGLPGTTFPSLFKVQSLNGSVTTIPFAVDHNRVDLINSNLFINGGEFYVKRTSGNDAFKVQNSGALTLNTNGTSSPLLGFFINSNNRNFFTITESQILFKDATHDLFKVNASGYLSARKVIVTLQNPYADYVFDKNYKLTPLSQVAKFIKKYHHLPNVPSLAEVEANNKQIDIGEMQVKLLEKVEELTLYILQQQKEIDALNAKLSK